MRLIDADKAEKGFADYCKENNIHPLRSEFDAEWIERFIDAQPTVEAEPITRCKDCKNYKLFTEVYVGKAYCEEYGGFITENDYCSRGAKMDGEGKEK